MNNQTKKKLDFSLFFLSLFHFKSYMKDSKVIAFGVVFIFVNLLFNFIGVFGSLNGDKIEDLFFFRIIGNIFITFFFLILNIIVSNYNYSSKSKKEYYNIEIRSGINIFTSFYYRFFVGMLVIYFYVTLNLIINLSFANSLPFETSQNLKIFTFPCLLYYLLSIVNIAIFSLFSILFKEMLSLITNITITIVISMGPVINTAINLISDNKVSVEAGRSTSAFNYQIKNGLDFYTSFNSSNSEEIKNLFDPESVKQTFSNVNEVTLENFDYELNHSFNNINLVQNGDPNNALASRALYLGQLNYINNAGKHLFSDDSPIQKIINNIYGVINKFDSDYKGIGMTGNLYDSWLFINRQLKNENYITLDLNKITKFLIEELPEYKKLFEWINIDYTNNSVLINKNRGDGFIFPYKISNQSNPDNWKSMLWIDDINESNELDKKNLEVIDTYYNNPDLMILNWYLFNSWRNSMYIDVNKNLNGLIRNSNEGNFNDYKNALNQIKGKIKSEVFNYYNYLSIGYGKDNFLWDWIGSMYTGNTNWPRYSYDINGVESIVKNQLKYEPIFKDKDLKINNSFNPALVISMSVLIAIAIIGLSSFVFYKKRLI